MIDEHSEPIEGARPDAASTLATALAFAVGILITYIAASTLWSQVLPGRARLAIVLSQVTGLLVPSLVAAALLRRRGHRFEPAEPPNASVTRHLPVLLWMSATGFVAASAISVTWRVLLVATGWAWVDEIQQLWLDAFGKILRADDKLEAVAVLALVSLLPAACEEITFRRCLLGLLSSRLTGAVAIGLSSAVFASFHLDPLHFPGLLFLGVSMGIAYHRTGSVWASALLHALHNGVSASLLLATGALNDPEQAASAAQGLPLGVAFVTGGTSVVALAAWGLGVQFLPSRGRPPETA